MTQLTSWGNHAGTAKVWRPNWCGEDLPEGPLLPFGNGRSQGDVALLDAGTLIDMRGLNRFISVDWEAGTITCEAGVLLRDILAVTLPKGWILPVTPGTGFVTVGGAIANDVHGKNHHAAGSFGHHVESLTLRRSDGRTLACSATENKEMFRATIGGLGLTGLVEQATLKLQRIESGMVDVETVRTKHVREFFDLAVAADKDWDYTIYWVDGAAPVGQIGRGWFERGRLSRGGDGLIQPRKPLVSIKFRLPLSAVNGLTARVFCAAWYHRPRGVAARVGYSGFLFPLDVVGDWNRLYGPMRTVKFQMVLPLAVAPDVVEKVLLKVRAAGQVPCISTMKLMGSMKPAGLLSFPSAGVSLTLEDMWYEGAKTDTMLRALEELVLGAGGALYPAKDSTMSPAAYSASYPNVGKFMACKDPLFTSLFWQRVGGVMV